MLITDQAQQQPRCSGLLAIQEEQGTGLAVWAVAQSTSRCRRWGAQQGVEWKYRQVGQR